MSDKQETKSSECLEGVSGRAARRNFIKKSGRAAIAAPAAVLLLSAASKSTIAQAASGGQTPVFDTKGKKNILDP